ncbi:hypothetical protein Nepgr_018653 [Nepenthes gracilis]|uniref:Uncharacterized protein n=1 Tax=Nepenthes gracilis TaxID=150966 RepID=A0AAD3XT88_NEPGR|nr:hypothetical protein Nepgr_018653 [Nepenthes gracilis]
MELLYFADDATHVDNPSPVVHHHRLSIWFLKSHRLRLLSFLKHCHGPLRVCFSTSHKVTPATELWLLDPPPPPSLIRLALACHFQICQVHSVLIIFAILALHPTYILPGLG